MRKNISVKLIVVEILFFVNLLIGDTTYVSGVIDTNSVWVRSGSPYVVVGDVEINPGVCLNIQSGVEVLFAQSTALIVKGKLLAIGTVNEPIIFSALNPNSCWSKIWIKPEANPCSLKYCRISYANNSGIHNEDTLYVGYSVITNNSAPRGGGIFNSGLITITNTVISNNTACTYGGGIYNSNGKVLIKDNLITDNQANLEGGGIYNYSGVITMIDNTITTNRASKGGGVYNYQGNITITNNTIVNNQAENDGGAICNANGILTITNTRILENRSSESGGGIYNQGGNMRITRTSIENNQAEMDGGGIYNEEGDEEQEVIISDNSIGGNRAYCGGGIYNSYGNITLTNTTIINNQAEEGGGIYNAGYEEQRVTISNNTFIGNTAHLGGGIYNTDGNITIIGNTITNNYAEEGGGGIYNEGEEDQMVSITNNTITNNYSENCGGGIYNIEGVAVIINNAISHNGSSQGGGIYNEQEGTLIITNNTINGNFAENLGGGIYNEEGMVFITENSIINNFTEGDGGSIYNNGGAIITHNIIIDQSESTIWIDNSLITLNYNSLYNLSEEGFIIYNDTPDTINARYNYWYTTDTTIINQRIYDFYDDPNLGIVWYLPMLYSPIVKEKESISENYKKEFKIYPNPATRYFTVTLPHHVRWITIKVYDAMGKMIFAKDFGNKLTREIKVFFNEKLKPGIYLVEIKTNDQEFREKIIFK